MITCVNKAMKSWLRKLDKSDVKIRRLPVRLQRLLDGGFKEVQGCVLYAKDAKDFNPKSNTNPLDASRLCLHVHMQDECPRAKDNLAKSLAYALAFAQRAVKLMKEQIPHLEFKAMISIDQEAKDVVVHPEAIPGYVEVNVEDFDQAVMEYRTK